MRYNLDFKLKVIAYYMQGHTGRATAEEFNLDNKIVIRWVKQYQSGGIEAIKPKTSKAYYSREFKHEVITIMLSQGLSQLEVALIPILKNNTQVAPLPLSDRPNSVSLITQCIPSVTCRIDNRIITLKTAIR